MTNETENASTGGQESNFDVLTFIEELFTGGGRKISTAFLSTSQGLGYFKFSIHIMIVFFSVPCKIFLQYLYSTNVFH